MLDNTYTEPGDIADAPPLHHFVWSHRDALRNAGELLLGFVGRGLVDNLIDRLGREHVPSLATWRLLDQLRDLLTLRHVHDPSRPEAGFFAVVDPASPDVEEFCLLSDGLATAMRATPRPRPKRRKPSIPGFPPARRGDRKVVVEKRRPRRIAARRVSAKGIAAKPGRTVSAGRPILSLGGLRQ